MNIPLYFLNMGKKNRTKFTIYISKDIRGIKLKKKDRAFNMGQNKFWCKAWF